VGRLLQEAGSSDAAVSQPARTHISQWWERKFRVIAVILKKASLRVAAAASAGAGWVLVVARRECAAGSQQGDDIPEEAGLLNL
jgi:hypothetical protein